MDIMVEVGRRIKELRESKGISQKDLAYIADLDRSYIASIESGRRNVSIKNVVKITTALEISIKEFFNTDNFSNDYNS
jgi:transcriptional regulator with XRE-family HTH domain